MAVRRREHHHRVAADIDPLAAAARLAAAGLADTYVVYERGGRWSFAGGALAEIRLDQRGVHARWGGRKRRLPLSDHPLRGVGELLAELPVAGWRAYGWASFELAYLLHGMADAGDETLLHLVVPEFEVHLDATGATLRGTDPAMLQVLADLATEPAPDPGYTAAPHVVDLMAGAGYRDAVTAAVEEIRGRQFQKVILSRVVPVEFAVDFPGTYVVGRRANNPARSFLLDVGGRQCTGFSPETIVEVSADGRVTTQPLAGTRARSDNAAETARLAEDLLSDPKEIFEHAVSVKLAYQEMARCCAPGTVNVAEFMDVKERGSVQHLGSAVTGQLAAGHTAWDAFATLFPAVTASGIPKPAALAGIRRHELGRRGLYSGAVLTVDHTGELDAALVLRAVYRQGGQTWLRAGAGIVEPSRAAREYQETCEKLHSVALHVVAAHQPSEVAAGNPAVEAAAGTGAR